MEENAAVIVAAVRSTGKEWSLLENAEFEDKNEMEKWIKVNNFAKCRTNRNKDRTVTSLTCKIKGCGKLCQAIFINEVAEE